MDSEVQFNHHGSQLPSLTSPFTPAPRLRAHPQPLASDIPSSAPTSPAPLPTGRVPSPPSTSSINSSPDYSEDDDNDDNDDDNTGKVRWHPEVLWFAQRMEKVERRHGSLAHRDFPVSLISSSSARMFNMQFQWMKPTRTKRPTEAPATALRHKSSEGRVLRFQPVDEDEDSESSDEVCCKLFIFVLGWLNRFSFHRRICVIVGYVVSYSQTKWKT